METPLGAAIATLIAASPNLLIAAWVIIRQDRRIDELLTSQKWLIEQLMALHPPQAADGNPPVQLPPS